MYVNRHLYRYKCIFSALFLQLIDACLYFSVEIKLKLKLITKKLCVSNKLLYCSNSGLSRCCSWVQPPSLYTSTTLTFR